MTRKEAQMNPDPASEPMKRGEKPAVGYLIMIQGHVSPSLLDWFGD